MRRSRSLSVTAMSFSVARWQGRACKVGTEVPQSHHACKARKANHWVFLHFFSLLHLPYYFQEQAVNFGCFDLISKDFAGTVPILPRGRRVHIEPHRRHPTHLQTFAKDLPVSGCAHEPERLKMWVCVLPAQPLQHRSVFSLLI